MRASVARIVTGLFALALAAGCQMRAAEQADDGGGAAGAGEAAKGTQVSTADPEALAAVNERWRQAALAGDASALASLYAEDAVLLPPGMPKVRGRAAIESAFAAMFESPPTSMTLQSDGTVFSESGELAFDHGTYAMSGTTPDGQAWQDTGKFLGIFKLIDGEWKYVADTWNSDAPSM